MPNVGPLELAVVLIIALVIFGPKRLPELGKSAGKGIREFRSSLAGKDDEEEKIENTKRELEPASSESDSSSPVEGEIVTGERS